MQHVKLSSRRLLLGLAAAVLLAPANAAVAGRPVARWDVVAYQRIDASFKVGCVAFHPDGVKVEFRVNGSLVHTADNPTLNDRVDVWEHWFSFDPSGYADGAVTIDARAICLNGTDPDYDLPSLTLYANSGGALDVPTVKWADAVNGSDANPGTEAQPYQTLNMAVDNTPAGGTVYLKAGTYSPDAINAGTSRSYWTTVAAAPGLGWDDVELTTGRPKTDKLRFKDLSIFTTSTSGSYLAMLTGEQGATSVWLDNVKMWNKSGRWAASTFPTGNGYPAYTTGGLTTWLREGPAGSLVRDHQVIEIGSDVFTGENRLVVNCLVDGVDCGSTGWHPDFHQAYAPEPNWCENMIMYNVKAYNCNCQGFFGARLRDSAFVNVLFERVPDVSFRSQYSEEMVNNMWFHITMINQSWYWRGVGSDALAATDVTLENCIFANMALAEDATDSGLYIDTNHFSGSSMGTNITTGDPLYVDAANEEYTLQSGSPARATGKVLQCVPADVDGVAYDPVSRNKGAFAGGGAGNLPPTADAGPDQSVDDADDSGAEDVTLDGAGSTDSDGTIVSYVWEENAAQIATGVSPTVTLDVNTHTIDLTVTDDDSDTGTDSVVVTVNAYVNVPPTADAGPDQSVDDADDSGAEDVTLDGAGSTDADGTIVSYVWEENAAQIATGVSPTVTLDVNVHTIDLTVTDDDSDTGTDSVVVTVNEWSGGGSVYAIDGHTDDILRRSDGTSRWIGQADFRVGGDTAGADGAAIIPFQLPTLDPGETVAAASFDINLQGLGNAPAGHVDLYGLGYRSSSTVYSTDFYQGVYGGDATDAWAVQDDFALLSTPTGHVVTDATGEANLTSYIEAQYAAGAQGGDYVFIRLNPDIADVADYRYWVFTSSNGSPKPLLTIETQVVGNDPPVADAGPDQSVDDADDSGAEDVTLDGAGSTDADGTIVSYVWEENAAQIATGVSPTVTLDVNVHTIDLTVTDDDSDTGTDSVVVTVNEWSVTSSTAWQNFAIAGQTGRFLFEFDAAPNNAGMDGITGVSSGAATWWSDVACIVRFAAAGQIDVRNGGAYGADASLSYVAGTTYHFEMDINVVQHTYSVTVTPDGQAPVVLATDYAFRTEQAGVTSLDNWVLNATNAGDSHTVSNVSVTEIVNGPPTADAGADQTVTDTDDSGGEDVTLDGSGSSDSDGFIVSYVWEENATQIAAGVSPTVTLDVNVHTIDLTVTDDLNGTGADSVVVTVEAAPYVGPKLEVGVVTADDQWTTVNLSRSYTSMVVVCAANYDSASGPAVVRVRNASGSSFDVLVQAAGGGTPGLTDVHYMVVEEGVYTQATDGVTMEAATFTSTVTDRKNGWTGQSRTYANAYSSPIVVGQVMSTNDAEYSNFWCCNGNRSTPPDGSGLTVGKHVGEDSITTRADETLGYVVIEAGSGTIGGYDYLAALGGDSIQGVTNSPPYSYSLSGLSAPVAAIVQQAAEDGGDGGWAVLYGASPLSATTLNLAIDEDQIGDSERSHTTEQVGYIIFE